MEIVDDEILKMYIEESREHLADIEEDLLKVEAQGADIDEDLVNKVFRAAHSIKGGSGFLDLTRIQELAHKTENVLAMIRAREMTPTPEVINILLLAFDRLRELINNHQTSNQADISEMVAALTQLASSHLPQAEKGSLQRQVQVPAPQGGRSLNVSEFDLTHAKKTGKFVYRVEYDLIHDVHRLGKTPLQVFKDLTACGDILECVIDLAAVGDLDDEVTNRIPFVVLFATVADPGLAPDLFAVDNEKIHLVYDADKREMVAQEAPAPAASAAEPVPSAPPIVTIPPPVEAPAPVAPPPAPESPTVPAPSNGNGKDSAPASSSAVPRAATAPAETSLRVNVDLLESLMNLAGELVLSRNQLMEAIAQGDQRAISASGQRINMVTSELQETIMMTRMQPIGNIFNKFPRVVRDLAKELSKDVRLDLEGKEVEMDKTIIEGLSDPLTHMVRNAVDHGIETPEARVRAGKPATGTISLRAYHEAGQVIIEIADDGKGLDGKKIAASALAKGLVTPEQVRLMSDKEMMALIFLPGLSTAEKVTDISGRGVGMDVVKTNLDKLGGKVEIESQPGRGSIFRIKLPLTLAIIPCLLVSVEEEMFAIPQVNVDELIRISAAQIKNRIEMVGDAEVLILRGKLIPIVHLADALDIQRTFIDPRDGQRKPDRRAIADRRSRRQGLLEGRGEDDADQRFAEQRAGSDRRYHAASDLNIVVVTAGAFQYGLIVEKLHDTIEIVVKPLGRHFKQAREYAGATIMGDGRVALILDVAGLAGLAGLSSLAGSARSRELAEDAGGERRQEAHSLLLFRNGPGEQCAVPLDLVARVEQIRAADIESVGGRRVIQYRGLSLPVFALNEVAAVQSLDLGQDPVVVVFQIYGREVGLLASQPVDVIECEAAIDQSTLRQRGVMGSTIINQRTTLLIDIFELVETLHPEWAAGKQPQRPALAEGADAILLAEDSDFFRSQVRKFIEETGYTVLAAEDGQRAWELLLANADRVRMVVTDIEMPNLDGLGLTRNIRRDPRFAGLPVVALTSLAGEDDIARGKAVGVTDYQVKLDKERLVEAIARLMGGAPLVSAAP